MAATHASSLRCAKMLLAAGADPDAAGTEPPIASGKGLAQGAAPPFVKTALGIALSQEDERMAELLLRSGADPARPDGMGQTPLMWACQRGLIAWVERLALLSDVDAIDLYGDCAMRRCELAWPEPATMEAMQAGLNHGKRMREASLEAAELEKAMDGPPASPTVAGPGRFRM